jgi:peptidoglycan hydrolase CwlO-like protein
MENTSTLVSGLEYKVRKLVDRQQKLEQQYQDLQQKNIELNNLIENQKNRIKELEEKITILKLVKTIEQKEGKSEAKLKITELMREIDRCIGLLNK